MTAIPAVMALRRTTATLVSTHDPIAQELRWFLQRDYEGDLGVRSSLALQIETIQLGGYRDSTSRACLDLSDTILEAATRLRRLEARWAQLSRWHQDVLWCVYGLPKRRLSEYGELGTLVLFLAVRAQRDADTAQLERWLSRLKGRDNARFHRIKDNARRVLDEARGSWHATWAIGRRR